jgi:hypothetical protein
MAIRYLRWMHSKPYISMHACQGVWPPTEWLLNHFAMLRAVDLISAAGQ